MGGIRLDRCDHMQIGKFKNNQLSRQSSMVVQFERNGLDGLDLNISNLRYAKIQQELLCK